MDATQKCENRRTSENTLLSPRYLFISNTFNLSRTAKFYKFTRYFLLGHTSSFRGFTLVSQFHGIWIGNYNYEHVSVWVWLLFLWFQRVSLSDLRQDKMQEGKKLLSETLSNTKIAILLTEFNCKICNWLISKKMLFCFIPKVLLFGNLPTSVYLKLRSLKTT